MITDIAKKLTDIRPQWKALADKRDITKEDIAALCIYRAVYKEQIPEGGKTRLLKAFQPITNANKLNNGADPNGALIVALNSVKYSHLADWLDKDELKQLVDAAKEILKAGLK